MVFILSPLAPFLSFLTAFSALLSFSFPLSRLLYLILLSFHLYFSFLGLSCPWYLASIYSFPFLSLSIPSSSITLLFPILTIPQPVAEQYQQQPPQYQQYQQPPYQMVYSTFFLVFSFLYSLPYTTLLSSLFQYQQPQPYQMVPILLLSSLGLIFAILSNYIPLLFCTLSFLLSLLSSLLFPLTDLFIRNNTNKPPIKQKRVAKKTRKTRKIRKRKSARKKKRSAKRRRKRKKRSTSKFESIINYMFIEDRTSNFT